ncbi:sterigmatocystin 8-O-methyltransferase [Ophiocordyceps sinensis CO18]|nr:sterigmatocystin 8-O-methyltransferase [Ophiocordyceps sinensis CO18]
MDNNDAKCVEMLRAVAGAMSASSRLLVHDFVDPPTFGEDRPRPLDMLDLHMIASLNTHSRREAEWDALIRGAGEGLVRHRTWGGNDGSAVLEMRLEQREA